MSLDRDAWLSGFLARPVLLTLAVCGLLTGTTQAVASPHADTVVSYTPGTAAGSGYEDPTTALGAPSRTTGGPSDVTVFNSPFGSNEIVSVGAGGELTVRFDTPILDDPLNPFGIDLLVFGNAFFTADFFATPPTVTGVSAEPGAIFVSADGITFLEVPGVTADGLFPTQGYTDTTDPFGGFGGFNDGATPTDFLRPVDPALTLADLIGLDMPGVVSAYGGAGGGAGIDLASVGLPLVQYVRVVGGAGGTTEIDGFSDVAALPIPEPGAAVLLGLGLAGLACAGRGSQRLSGLDRA